MGRILSVDIVKKTLLNLNLELLSPYIKDSIPIEYKCLNCGDVHRANFSNLKRKNIKNCKSCWVKSTKKNSRTIYS